jgi:putative ABC transport system permease protein
LAAVFLVGLLPVFQSGRADPNESLKRDGRSTTAGRGARRARQGLIVGEVALAAMLALGAGLLLRSLLNLQRVDRGVDADAVITMRLTLPQERYGTREAINAFFAELARRVEALPTVRRAGLASQFPPQEFFRMRVLVEGTAAPGGTTLPTAYATVASRGYFEAVGMTRRAGRTFDDRDRAGSPRVIVVNDAFVSRYLGGRAPLGARIRMGDNPEQAPLAELIGVVSDTSNAGAASAPAPEVFVPLEQRPDNQLFLVAKMTGDPISAVTTLRQTVISIDPDQPVYAIQTLNQAFETSILPQQVSTVLLAIFALVALTLAGVGIYGVTAYAVRSRTQEIGIRMAMGAGRSSVVWMVLRQVLPLVAAGLSIGVGAALALGLVLSSMLFGVSPIDPLTVGATAAVLGAVAMAAAWRPAAIASRVDPVIALRYE